MNERVYELNNLFASFGDGQEILLLITLTAFQKMINEYIMQTYVSPEDREDSKILKYRFADKLKQLLSSNKRPPSSSSDKSAKRSRSGSGGTLKDGNIDTPEDLVEAYYYKEKDEVLKEFIQEDEGVGCIQQ